MIPHSRHRSCDLNLSNYWAGLWRSHWVLEFTTGSTSGTLKGTVHSNVHYFEDGNVQLYATKEVTASNVSDVASLIESKYDVRLL